MLHRMKRLELTGAELHAHLVDLLDPHAVLPGDATALADAELEDLAAERLRPGNLVRDVAIEKDEGMQIAITGMEHVAAAQREPGLHLPDRLQHGGEPLAWDGAVHAVVIGREGPHCWKRRLATRPEAQPLALVTRDPTFRGACAAHHGLDAQDLLFDLLGYAIGLAEQYRLGVERVAGMDEGL